MLKGFLHGMFMKQTYLVSGFTHFFQRSQNFFFRPMLDIPTVKLNDVHLLFAGKCLPSLKFDKSLFTQFSFFLNCIHVHCCQLKPTYILKELLPFRNTGLFLRVTRRHPTPIKRGKMHDKGHIWGKFSLNVVLHHFIFV